MKFFRRAASEQVEPDDDVPLVAVPSTVPARGGPTQLLLARGVITPEQVEQARKDATPGRRLEAALVALGAATERQIAEVTAETLGVPFVAPGPADVDADALARLGGPAVALRRGAVPLVGGRCALADPADVFLIDELRRTFGRALQVCCAAPSDVARALETTRAPTDAGEAVGDIIKDLADEESVELVSSAADAPKDDAGDDADLAKAGSESPVIRFVNYLIGDALRQGASDIHVEPKERELVVRYRVDGVLVEAMRPPKSMHAAVTSRLKIMANLDISERRLPQDGRIRATVGGRKLDLRLSTLPCAAGEKSCLRILDAKSINVPLEALGFGEAALTIWHRQIEQPHGILLVTGPTGSGKTTTLYSSLRCMDGARLNISTVEDPVEYHLPAANQVQVHDKIGMTFAAALRSLLRQDPDVVMLGEIRDAETARTAVQASLTGHLVLSTLHTNDAPSSITRLINVGVEPYLISAALNAVLAQRLVRKACAVCKAKVEPQGELREFLQLQSYPLDQVWRGQGCDACRGTGYKGRLGIYELLVMDDKLRDTVTGNPDVNHFRKLCRERGLVTLREDGFAKCEQGLTTVEEVLRVTESAS